MVCLGVVGAAAFSLQYLQLVNHSPDAATITVTVLHLWTAAMAFVVPWCVVASVPPTFGLAVLAGWITTGSAIYLANNALLLHDDVNRDSGFVFECTLLLLTLVALGVSRRSTAHPMTDR
jgi:amino acid permease